MKHLYFRNSFVSIYYDKEQLLGKAVWHGELFGSEFREAVLLCLDLIERHGLRGWLGDNRKMRSIHPNDQAWSVKVFVPQLMDSPLLRLANIASESEQNRKAVDVMYNKASNLTEKLVVREFYGEAEAATWLRELVN